MKCAIITGASRGIGRAIAQELAKDGWNLSLVARDESKLASTAKELSSEGIEVIYFAGDVSDFNFAKKVVDETYERFSEITGLVNNAGITVDKFLLRMTEEDWDRVISVNLKSVFNFSKFASRYMLKQKKGVIINISSVVGIVGNAGQSAYSASKAGIIAFTKSLSKELGSRNIRVNAVAPGFIETDMTKQLPESVVKEYLSKIPLGRLGRVEDVAKVVRFLMSDDASYITGQVIVVDGGML